MDAPYNFSYPGLNSPHRPSIIHAKATTADQKKQFDPLGLTIVSFVREADGYPLKSACARLHDCRPSFHSFAATLHQTLLGVLGRDQPDLEDEQRRQIEQAVIDVMNDVLPQEPQFAVTVQGIWLGGDFRCIEGNVVAAIDPKSRQRIEALSERLVEKLEPLLAKTHPGIKLRPAKGVKITGGFIDEQEDFFVDRELAQALEEVCHVETELWIESMSLVRFPYKSLEGATNPLDSESANNSLGEPGIVHQVQLQPPSDSPFRQTTVKPKLLATPRWVDWRGFSLLIDPPIGSLVDHANTGIQRITCQPWSDHELGLFRAFGDALAEVGLDSGVNHYTFFPLPTSSYHCTVWDGINEENLSLLSNEEGGNTLSKARERYADFLLGLPGSVKSAPPDLIPRDTFKGVIDSDPIRFRFAGLSIWGDSVLVARLIPAGETSARILDRICERRKQLDEQFAPLGRPKSPDYNPHCSLGYFLTPQGARAAAANLPQWERIFRRRTAGHQLAAVSVSAYAFTSMETFLKID